MPVLAEQPRDHVGQRRRRAGCSGDRFTATCRSCPARAQAARRRSASSSTCRVSGRIRPVCSASGMNSSGGTKPRPGGASGPAPRRRPPGRCAGRPSAGTPPSARGARSPRAGRRSAPAGAGVFWSSAARRARIPARACLAAYMATSARWSRVCASSPCSGRAATPMLARAVRVRWPIRIGSLEGAGRARPPAATTASVGRRGGQQDGELVAAEPGDRAAVAEVVLQPLRRPRGAARRRCRGPSASLTSLNRSRSSSRTAAVPPAPASASAASSSSWNWRRFGSPVSGSCRARCSFSATSPRSRSTRPALASDGAGVVGQRLEQPQPRRR